MLQFCLKIFCPLLCAKTGFSSLMVPKRVKQGCWPELSLVLLTRHGLMRHMFPGPGHFLLQASCAIMGWKATLL